MRVYLNSIGCRLNQSEIETMARQLLANGHEIVGEPSAADKVIINTCTVTREAAKDARKMTRRIHRENERAEAEAGKTARRLKSSIEAGGHIQTTLVGPVPCFFSKLRGEYRWQIILRGPNPAEILQGQRFDGWRVEVDPTSLL